MNDRAEIIGWTSGCITLAIVVLGALFLVTSCVSTESQREADLRKACIANGGTVINARGEGGTGSQHHCLIGTGRS